MSLSLIVLTRNEALCVEKNLNLIYSYLKENFSDAEIIVSDFSEDKTPEIVNKISSKIKGIKLVKVPKRGIGAGLKAGMNAASNEIIMFFPIDLSWNLETIKRSVKKLNNNSDFVIGSRWCMGGSTKRPLIRNIFSKIYNTLVNVLFGINVKDTQGTFAIKRTNLKKFDNLLESDDPFLQTEIVLHVKNNGLQISNVVERRGHSNISLFRESRLMFYKIIRFWYKYKVKRPA